MNQEVVWKFIPGHEDYMASNIGEIISLKHGRRLKRKLSVDPKGYNRLSICMNGKMSTIKIHRIVAILFIENPHNLPEVNHIDGNKKNNNVSNLEWVSHCSNMAHASKNNLLTYGSANTSSKLKESDIPVIRNLLLSGNLSKRAIGRKFGVSLPTILAI